ncbi:MAG: DUF4870 domain-containing protein [Cyanobacteriota bacterium]|nr:DUF4870 domain-containing protein [Cyanobacteriota bacterium]
MKDTNRNAKNLAIFCHLSSLCWFLLILVGLPMPFFANLIGPLVVWLAARNESEFVDRHGRESINFQISMIIYGIGLILVSIALLFLYLIAVGGSANPDGGAFILGAAILGGIGWLTLLAVFSLVQLVLVIMAAVKASQGKYYRYPLTLRLIRDRR